MIEDQLLCEIMQRISDRDESALAELYNQTVEKVFSIAFRITGQATAAEEIVSDVYFQVWRMSERYDITRGRIITWLLTICRSRAIDWLRRRDEAVLHDNPEVLRCEVSITNDEPHRFVEMFERNSAIRLAIGKLSEKEQRFVGLAFFRGLTHREIADLTNTPLGSVKSVIRNALLSLRESLVCYSVSEE